MLQLQIEHVLLSVVLLALLPTCIAVLWSLRTARRAIALHRRQAEDRFHSLAQNVSDIITIFETDGRVRYQSPSIERVLGYRPDEMIEGSPWFFVHPGDLASLQRHFASSAEQPGVRPPVEVRVAHANGSWRYLEAVANNLLHDPQVRGIVVTSRDITERKLLEERLARQAFYDPLTQLPNRALFMERLEQALADAAEQGERVAVCFVDLDGFKVVNDSLGHGLGDQLLTAVARRLASCVDPGDMVARFGGDEFTILIGNAVQPSVAVRTAERVIRALRRPVSLADREVTVGASAGIAFCPPGGTARPEDLLREADTALYEAKAAGKGRVVVFQPRMNTRVVQRLSLESDLRRAIDRGEFVLHYQPEVELRSGRIVGMEALVRWQHPRLGEIKPEDFIPFAEETGLIMPLGQWVLEAACRQARLWQIQRRDEEPLVMSVNLSARQFQQDDLAEQVTRVLRRTGLRPDGLKLEITETALMCEERRAVRTLEHLKGLGLRLAIDDFGTGYSSLSYLRRFAVDTLKVDRSFLNGLERDGTAVAIVQAITTLAHALGMDVTVEGVETAEQLARARTILCDHGQGFYFSRPLPSEELAGLILPGPTPIRQAS
jgi:diguanylate cyclase (GGDEF)-like protein/PAS domain S-box-containing protein